MRGNPLSILGTCSTSNLQNLGNPGVIKVSAWDAEVLPREKRGYMGLGVLWLSMMLP